MDNVQLLKDMGFTRVEIEIVRKPTFWWASPTIINEISGEPEGIFQEKTFENKSIAEIVASISVSASNNGYRRAKIESRKSLADDLESATKKLIKKFRKSY